MLYLNCLKQVALPETSYKQYLDGPNIVYESRITELEAKLTQMRHDLKKAQDEAYGYKQKLNDCSPSSTSSEFYKQIESLHR